MLILGLITFLSRFYHIFCTFIFAVLLQKQSFYVDGQFPRPWRHWTLNILGSRFWSLGVMWRHRNVTIGLDESTFLLVVNDDHASILHGYGDMGLQRFGDHKFVNVKVISLTITLSNCQCDVE